MKFATVLSLLCITLFTLGCKKSSIHQITYYVENPGSDSMFVEVVSVGSTERWGVGLPTEASFPGAGNSLSLYYSTFMADESDPETDLLPSTLFDSVFVFTVANGQNSLIYSGINNADWDFEPQKRKGIFKYALRP